MAEIDHSKIYRNHFAQSEDVMSKWFYAVQDCNQHVRVIVGAARLSEQLGFILQARFLADQSLQSSLLDGDRPLSSFSSRIKLCHALGIISPWVARELDLIRRIRNQAAHTSDELLLSESPFRDWCSELRAWRQFADAGLFDGSDSAQRFTYTVLWMSTNLSNLYRHIRRARLPIPSSVDFALMDESEAARIRANVKDGRILLSAKKWDIPGTDPPHESEDDSP